MTGVDATALEEALEALLPLPSEQGGTIVVLATAGSPPAVALLSTGDVLIDGETVRAVVYAGASAARRLGGAFTLLVPVGDHAVRVETGDASARSEGDLVVLEGALLDVRPTSEPPWAIDMHFFATTGAGVPEHLTYWRGVRQWLEGGATGQSPPTP